MTLCHEDEHPLLLECFLTSLRRIRMIERVSHIYMIPLWSTPCLFYQITTTQISSEISNFGHQIVQGNMILCNEDRHPLLLECFLTSLRCIRTIVRASDSLSDPPMVNTVSFLQKKPSNLKPYNQFWAPDWLSKCNVVSCG